MSYVRGTYKLVQPQQAPPTPVQTLNPIESAPSSIADKTLDPSDVRISALQQHVQGNPPASVRVLAP